MKGATIFQLISGVLLLIFLWRGLHNARRWWPLESQLAAMELQKTSARSVAEITTPIEAQEARYRMRFILYAVLFFILLSFFLLVTCIGF